MLTDDDHYQYYHRVVYEVTRSQVHVSFNDLIILKGIGKRWYELNEMYYA
jgi:hypothetical protein